MGDSVKPALHGRDHCLGGVDPIPCLRIASFRALHYNAATQTINNANDGYITWDRYQISDEAVFQAGAWAAGSPDTITVCDFLQRGLFAITVGVDITPAGTFTGSFGIALEDVGSTFMPSPGTIWPAAEPPGDNSTGFYCATWVLSFPPVWADLTSDTLAPDLPAMRVAFSNNVGSNVTIDYAFWEIHCLQRLDYEDQDEVGEIETQA